MTVAVESAVKEALRKADEGLKGVRYMTLGGAAFLSDLILRNDLKNLLELGTYHGKSSVFFGTALKARGYGKLTTLDRDQCLALNPNVKELIKKFELEDYVEVIIHPRSFTMTLLSMLEQEPRPQFDFCYFDGAHTWDITGFVFLLVDKMLKPGGWVVFDDMDWTIGAAAAGVPSRGERWQNEFSEDEAEMPQVRKVFEILVKDAGYTNMTEHKRLRWGLAQKPL